MLNKAISHTKLCFAVNLEQLRAVVRHEAEQSFYKTITKIK